MRGSCRICWRLTSTYGWELRLRLPLKSLAEQNEVFALLEDPLEPSLSSPTPALTRALFVVLLVLVHGILGFGALWKRRRRKIKPSDFIFERAGWMFQCSEDEPSRKDVRFLVVESTVQRSFVRPSEFLVSRLAEVSTQERGKHSFVRRGVTRSQGPAAYGSFTKTRPWMETRAWRSEDLEGCHVSLFSPDQVPRMDRQTFPSSYKFLKPAMKHTRKNGWVGKHSGGGNRRFLFDHCISRIDKR